MVLGRTADGSRIIAAAEDQALVRRLIDEEPLGGRITVAAGGEGRSLVTAFEAAGR